MNSTVKPIFNEKVVEKWYLWVLYTVHGTHKTDKSDEKVGKVRLLFMNSSRCPLLQLKKKKKKKKTQHKMQTWDSLLSKCSLNVLRLWCVLCLNFKINLKFDYFIKIKKFIVSDKLWLMKYIRFKKYSLLSKILKGFRKNYILQS